MTDFMYWIRENSYYCNIAFRYNFYVCHNNIRLVLLILQPQDFSDCQCLDQNDVLNSHRMSFILILHWIFECILRFRQGHATVSKNHYFMTSCLKLNPASLSASTSPDWQPASQSIYQMGLHFHRESYTWGTPSGRQWTDHVIVPMCGFMI